MSHSIEVKPAKHMDFPINGDETQTHVGTPMKPQQTQTPHMAMSILYAHRVKKYEKKKNMKFSKSAIKQRFCYHFEVVKV